MGSEMCIRDSAQRFLESDESMQGLRTVLKDANCRFTLLGFAKRRNPERQILSSATKAFKRARQLLEEAGYLQAKSSRQQLQAPQLAISSASAVNRRAARRGHASTTDGQVAGVALAAAAKKPAVSAENMSEEEYAELDKVLDGGDAVGDGQYWHYQTNEDRLSLLLGLLAGGGFFMLALWLLL